MSNISITEKLKFERLFQMNTGYVLSFSNNSLQEFVSESVGIDIYDDKYAYGSSGSKANQIRGFWREESNQIVGKLLSDLLEHWKGQKLIDLSEILDF